MKMSSGSVKTAILTVCCLLILTATAFLQQKQQREQQQQKTTAMRSPYDKTGMEPSGIYGWIALIDPATGERWLPQTGYPWLHLEFQKKRGGDRHEVHIMASQGIVRETARLAWRYAYQFDHNSTWTGNPRCADHNDIQYDPAEWTYVGHRAEFFFVETRSEAGQTGRTITFTKKGSPFPDLPSIFSQR